MGELKQKMLEYGHSTDEVAWIPLNFLPVDNLKRAFADSFGLPVAHLFSWVCCRPAVKIEFFARFGIYYHTTWQKRIMVQKKKNQYRTIICQQTRQKMQHIQKTATTKLKRVMPLPELKVKTIHPFHVCMMQTHQHKKLKSNINVNVNISV